MKKNKIRLTESDLHRIVKESVNKILQESQLNELDPRTYASYANKRAAQGDNRKAWEGQVAARDAYNKQFGTRVYGYGSGGNYHSSNHGMYGNDYTVTDSEQNVINDKHSYGHEQKYNPKNGSYEYRHWNGPTGETEPTIMPNSKLLDPRHKIAQQMAQGNGKYIKGKGWQ